MTDDAKQELWEREDICDLVDRAFESGIVSRNPSDAEEHVAYRYAIKLAIDETRQPQTDALFQSGYDGGIEAAAKALEADAKKCDCFARNEGECGCGAWCEWKSITSQRAIELVRALQELSK